MGATLKRAQWFPLTPQNFFLSESQNFPKNLFERPTPPPQLSQRGITPLPVEKFLTQTPFLGESSSLKECPPNQLRLFPRKYPPPAPKELEKKPFLPQPANLGLKRNLTPQNLSFP